MGKMLVQFTITPAPPDDYQIGTSDARLAKSRIENNPDLMKQIQDIAGDGTNNFIEWIAGGEWIYQTDQRYTQSKPERLKNAKRISSAARELAAALNETTWHELSHWEVSRHPDKEVMRLDRYLHWLADLTDRVIDLGQPHQECYPPAGSKVTRRAFMLRHIRRAVVSICRESERKIPRSRIYALARDIAIEVLEDEDITEEHIRGL